MITDAFKVLNPFQVSVDAAEVIQLPACHFSVNFPDKPIIQQLSAPAAGQTFPWSSALLKSNKGVFRHECTCVQGMNNGRIDASFVKRRMTEAARSNGLSNFHFTSLPFEHGVAVELRGYKDVSGIPATYVSRAFVTTDCYVDVMVAGASLSFPAPGMLPFLESIRHTGIAPLPEENWVEFQESPLGGRRAIDLNSVQVNGTVVSYRRKYVTSRGKSTVVTEDYIDCSTKYVRTGSATFFADDGSIQSSVEHSIEESPFMAAPNDPSIEKLSHLLCNDNRAAKPEEIRHRLRPQG
jgi:hypothetical protein